MDCTITCIIQSFVQALISRERLAEGNPQILNSELVAINCFLRKVVLNLFS